MRIDAYGQPVLSERDVMDLYMKNPEHSMKTCLVDFEPRADLEVVDAPQLQRWMEDAATVDQYDARNQSQWHMPQQYRDLDIAEWVLSQCTTDEQLQRVGMELMLYLERDAFPLLRYLKYLVDTMRQHNIVWGVGRGSSVSSYVLYLIGIHRIDSLYYDLDIREFLK